MSLSEAEPPPSMEAVAAEGARLARVWADVTAAEREAAYRYVERAVREAVASGGDAQHGRAAALAVACVAPLSELSAADSARVDATEWRRVILLVGELVALDAIPGVNRDGYVSAELYRPLGLSGSVVLGQMEAGGGAAGATLMKWQVSVTGLR